MSMIPMNGGQMEMLPEYKTKRVGFIVYDNSLYVQSETDERACYEWATEDLGMQDSVWEDSVRGCIADDGIYFYTSSYYECVDKSDISAAIVAELYDRLNVGGTVTIYNGMNVGVPGTEWTPICAVGEVSEGKVRIY